MSDTAKAHGVAMQFMQSDLFTARPSRGPRLPKLLGQSPKEPLRGLILLPLAKEKRTETGHQHVCFRIHHGKTHQ